jgi:ketosteroid isomerase-like protein
MAAVKKEISDLLEIYISSFNACDLEAAASYYDEPAFAISSSGASLLPSRADRASSFRSTVERLKSEGWDHSEFIGEKAIVELGEGLVLASCPCKRLKADGGSVEEFTATYTLRKLGGKDGKEGRGWVIVGIHHGEFGVKLKE